MAAAHEVHVSLTDVEPVMDLLKAGVQLYAAIYHMPGAAKFLTDDASKAVTRAYGEMQRAMRSSGKTLSLSVVQEETG